LVEALIEAKKNLMLWKHPKGDAFAKVIKTQMPILFIGKDTRAKRVGHWALQVEAYFETCHCGQHGLILNGIVFIS
jgi:hypothetical protein